MLIEVKVGPRKFCVDLANNTFWDVDDPAMTKDPSELRQDALDWACTHHTFQAWCDTDFAAFVIELEKAINEALVKHGSLIFIDMSLGEEERKNSGNMEKLLDMISIQMQNTFDYDQM